MLEKFFENKSTMPPQTDAVLSQRIVNKTAKLTKAEAARRLHQERDDRWKVAGSIARALEQKAAQSEMVPNGAGTAVLAFIHPTGERIDARAIERARAATADAWEARQESANALHAAENELVAAEKWLQDLVDSRAHHARQAAADAALTDAERETRARRDAYQRDQAAR